MARQPMAMKGKLISSIHGIPAGTLVIVVEYNPNAPCIVSYEGKRYNVHKDNIELAELEDL